MPLELQLRYSGVSFNKVSNIFSLVTWEEITNEALLPG